VCPQSVISDLRELWGGADGGEGGCGGDCGGGG